MTLRLGLLVAGLPADRPVVVYCAAGWRSAEAARLLSASGVTRVENLRGLLSR